MNNIKASFAKTGNYPLNATLVTHSLPTSYPSHLTPRRVTSALDIGNKLVSHPAFLEIWRLDEKRKEEDKKRRGEMLKKQMKMNIKKRS
jgi:hypothetical protein